MEHSDDHAQSHPAGAPERRRAARQAFVTKGMLYREDRSAGPQRITLTDVSALGVGLDAATPVEPGSRCRILIEAGPTRIWWRMRVVCCGKIAEHLYRVGGEFVPVELERPEDAPDEPQWAEAPALLIVPS